MTQEKDGFYTETDPQEKIDDEAAYEWEHDNGDDLDELIAKKEASLNKRDVLFRRWVAFIIDAFLLGIVYIFGFIFLLTFVAASAYSCSPSNDSADMFAQIAIKLCTGASFMMYLVRDMFGTSLGKRLMKLSLVTDSGEKPVFWRRVLRNVLLALWPVEAITLLVTGKRVLDAALGLDVIIKDPTERKIRKICNK